MRNVFYIMVLLLFSCEEIKETEEGLPYDFLVSEAGIIFRLEILIKLMSFLVKFYFLMRTQFPTTRLHILGWDGQNSIKQKLCLLIL